MDLENLRRPPCERPQVRFRQPPEDRRRASLRLPALAALLILLAAAPPPLAAGGAGEGVASQTQQAPGEQPSFPPEDFPLEMPPEPAVLENYLEGVGYLGNFPDAWTTDKLLDPINAKLFLALQSGATREMLAGLQLPDLNLALADLISGRMVRQEGESFRPAFPLIRETTREAFLQTVQAAADEAYKSLRPSLKKIQKAARKEKVTPWLYALVWSEVLDSKLDEESLLDAGALDARRMRDEGYFWILVPGDPYTTGEERYGSGSETLHYLWTPTARLQPFVQNYPTRRRILDGALAKVPWDQPETRDGLQKTGILDPENHVRVPVLRKGSRLLSELRQASQTYAKDVLRSIKADTLARILEAPRDETVAAAFACTGYRVLERAVREGFVSRPDYLSRDEAPLLGLVEALVVTEDESFDPLERAFYLYDREDFTGSIQMSEKFLETHPGDPEALFRKGIALMKLRRYPEALQEFQRASEGPAPKSDVWRGWLLIREGNILDVMMKRDEALKKYAEALEFADVSGSHEIARNWLENAYQD
jgi:tetratricopeptide (TPR) repeat protein